MSLPAAVALLILVIVSGPACASSILILGDSLSAGLGISMQETWVEQLRARLAQEGYRYELVNASISGETSSGGRTRLPALLERHQPALVIIELGGNDGLRGIALRELRDNLTAMATLARQRGTSVIVVQMELPPNYGAAYNDRFRSLYAEVCGDTGTRLAPFLLDGIALNAELMQGDGIHPRAAAAPLILNNVWPTIESALSELALRSRSDRI